MFVGFDGRFRLRDLYFPHVGLWNHVSGNAIRFGIWAGGGFWWIGDDGWTIEMDFDDAAGSGSVEASHADCPLALGARVSIDLDRPLLSIDFQFTNRTELDVVARVFFTHDLCIQESDIGDTAFFDPVSNAMIHYKGPNWFLFQCSGPLGGPSQYAAGIKGFGGLEGTWKDAEDGELGMNPIAQGSVDSTLCVEAQVQGAGRSEVRYRIVCGSDAGVRADSARSPATTSKGKRRIARPDPFEGLPPDIAAFGNKSLAILLAHCDHGGAILASLDSDIMRTNRANYAYCWPRDGAMSALVLGKLGQKRVAREFFEFCFRAFDPALGFLMQKYRADGTLGATWHPWVVDGAPETPLQEDETALVLFALGEHLRGHPDRAFAERAYFGFVLPAAQFIAGFVDRRSGLPKPSYDLWEERRGVHAFTVGACIAGLRSAAMLAEPFDPESGEAFGASAMRFANALVERFRGPNGQGLRRSAGPGARHDETPDSSLLLLPLLGVLPPSHPAMSETIERVRSRLWVRSRVGGLARYQGDYYFRADPELPGNPWVISTLWLAQCSALRCASRADLDGPIDLLRWAIARAAPTGVLPEQVHPHTGEALSVSPLAWSHAEFLSAALLVKERIARLDGL